MTHGAGRYDPVRHLPRLLAEETWKSLWRCEGPSVTARLETALRAERRKARAGHWSYDLNRHIGLLQALKAERLRVRSAGGVAVGAGGRPEPVVEIGDGNADVVAEDEAGAIAGERQRQPQPEMHEMILDRP